MKVELDTTASGNNYADLGTQQMMSVPYALYALNAPVSIGEFSHYVGELFGGGIVVSVWKLGGIEHGLIASLVDLSSGVAWSNVNSSFAGATSLNNGQSNTIAIINQAGHITSAALCNNYISGAFSDWYLPSNWEINQCYNAAFIVNSVLGDANGFHSLYWSSTESSNINAYAAGFINGVPGASSKTTLYYVRAVRTY
ncbi:MAG: DUF1566 domain-containing protein [Bacteroidetes bacterium]|nr:DUF1566 domain-containing protein [Bacteroidota bacterium]